MDDAEREEALATTVNGAAVGVLAEETRRAGALLVHCSTDYAFDGRKDAPYTEDDPPCPGGAARAAALSPRLGLAGEIPRVVSHARQAKLCPSYRGFSSFPLRP